MALKIFCKWLFKNGLLKMFKKWLVKNVENGSFKMLKK